jgi:hypothetical protein
VCYRCRTKILGAREGVKGKPVQDRHGPATVSRKWFSTRHSVRTGEGGRSESASSTPPASQETYPGWLISLPCGEQVACK